MFEISSLTSLTISQVTMQYINSDKFDKTTHFKESLDLGCPIPLYICTIYHCFDRWFHAVLDYVTMISVHNHLPEYITEIYH